MLSTRLASSLPPRAQRDREASTEKPSASRCHLELPRRIRRGPCCRHGHPPARPVQRGQAHPFRRAPGGESHCMDVTPKAQATKAGTDKSAESKGKALRSQGRINRAQRPPPGQERMPANQAPDKELLQVHTRKPHVPGLKWTRDLSRQAAYVDTQVPAGA